MASVSFGKDSLAMLYLLITQQWPLDEVVFFNNGMEFQAIYDTRDKVLPHLAQLGIQYTELTPNRPFLYDMLERPVKNRDNEGTHHGYGWCGGLARWGTSEKLRAINAHTRNAIQYVGIAVDETHRFEKSKTPNRVLPLVHWEWTEAECLSFCYRLGFQWLEESTQGPVPLYEYLDRVSCFCCSNKNLKELKNIYRYFPQYWTRLRELQEHLERPMKGYYKGMPKGIFELEERFKREIEAETLFAPVSRKSPARRRNQRGHDR